MKKFTLLLTVALLLACSFGCERAESVKPIEKDALVEIIIYSQYCDGPIFYERNVKSCEPSYVLIDLLNNAKKTGKKVEKISDDVIDESVIRDYPVEFGTTWIEVSDRIYRISHDDSQIWLVTSHFGEGEELEMSEALTEAVFKAWNYTTAYVYRGTYKRGDESVALEVSNEGDSLVRMSIKKLTIEEGKTEKVKLSITAELTSLEDLETSVELLWEDVNTYISGDLKDVRLEKGVPTEVELSFESFFVPDTRLLIKADNTTARIQMDM